MRLKFGLLLALGCATNAHAGGDLVVEKAWIRAAPPGAAMLAGYATLKNDGDAVVVLTGASSPDFGDISLHESFNENGVERMRQLGDVVIAPGTSVVFAPGGKHFMLMDGKRELRAGDAVKIRISTKTGSGTDAQFSVSESAP